VFVVGEDRPAEAGKRGPFIDLATAAVSTISMKVASPGAESSQVVYSVEDVQSDETVLSRAMPPAKGFEGSAPSRNPPKAVRSTSEDSPWDSGTLLIPRKTTDHHRIARPPGSRAEDLLYKRKPFEMESLGVEAYLHRPYSPTPARFLPRPERADPSNLLLIPASVARAFRPPPV
jgi:hypothetical protein